MIVYHTENLGGRYEYRTKSHENWVMPPHIHEFSEFAYTISGTTTVHLNGKKYLIPKGHLLFILPNQIHEYSDKTPSILRCAVFSNDHLPAFFDILKKSVLESPIVDLSNMPHICEMIENSPSFNTLQITAMLNLICNEVISCSRLIKNDIGKNSVFYEAMRYISENFTEDIELKTVAKALGYHEKYLSSTLHSLTNMNFRTFLANYRINYAKELLLADGYKKMRISEIALKCGFSSINTFNRAFLSITGQTPREYKIAQSKLDM